jgi:hypothetical protein
MRLGVASLLFFILAASACDTRPRAPAIAVSAIEARPVELIRREGNHLVGQPSPYLEQHAHNPVDWYPWGDEALERARREHKLIFLSIGYATCHWCHVMERECFEDDETARALNARFVAIKVDREQRPDLDALFVEAVQRLGQEAGWPLTVILTPELEPVFGGTYFPRTQSGGRPGLRDVLAEVDERWQRDGPSLARRGHDLMIEIGRRSRAAAGEVSGELLRDAMAALGPARDPVEGGFGKRQKFPNAPLLLAELRFVERTGDAATQGHLTLTLDRALRGGIHDHLSGTFHRYAVDRAWHVPHFEKTLYDNAQLAALYLEASRALGEGDRAAAYERAGRAVLDDLIASWQRPDGGFVVGFDADDPAGEGAYYTFTPAELRRALGDDDARIVGALFGVKDAGERLLGGRSVLHRREDAEVGKEVGVEAGALAEAWARARPRLVALRAARPAPAVDDKELAGWNGLAIAALADAGRTLDEPRYVEAAERAARFVIDRCWDPKARALGRGRRSGAALGEGFLDDHALAALGLLRLHAADGDLAWLAHARAIAGAIVDRFHDEELEAFVGAAAQPGGAARLPLRRPDVDDGVVPSGGAAATLLLLELGAIAGDQAIYDRGARALRAAAPRARAEPFSSGFFLVAVDHATAKVREVVIAGDASDPRTRSLRRELAGTRDGRVLVVLLPAAGAPPELARDFPALAGKIALSGKPTAFVCERGACEAPTGDPGVLRRQLAAAR